MLTDTASLSNKSISFSGNSRVCEQSNGYFGALVIHYYVIRLANQKNIETAKAFCNIHIVISHYFFNKFNHTLSETVKH